MQRKMTVRKFENFSNKLEKSKKEYKEGKVHDTRNVFKKMQEKYGY